MTDPDTSHLDIGELRCDPVTEKWVAIASNRSKRPHDFPSNTGTQKELQAYKDDCPFCNLSRYPQEQSIIRLPNSPDAWHVHIFKNKYPAFSPKNEFRTWMEGPHRTIESVGYHELLATKKHHHIDALMPLKIHKMTIEALRIRYRQLASKPSVHYIQVIKNHGKDAGASIEHPHHQIFTTPILPHDIGDILSGTERFAKTHNISPYEAMLSFEVKRGDRIVWENDHFTAYCPYVSRSPFETWIMPKKHSSSFDSITIKEIESLAEIMQHVFGKLYTHLNNPPYNYYIHSAPCDTRGYVCETQTFKHFRWYVAIIPRIQKIAGFELGTGLEINTVPPENAAKFLRDAPLPDPVV